MFAIAISLVGGPYSFEVNRGLMLEPFLSAHMNDPIDKTSLGSGVRLGYSLANLTDAYISAELSAEADTIFDGASYLGKPRVNYIGKAGLSFYEIYNPMALRVLLGGGAEHRKQSKYSPLIFYRVGIGRYFFKNFGVFADFGQEEIFRHIGWTLPLDLGLSFSFIF